MKKLIYNFSISWIAPYSATICKLWEKNHVSKIVNGASFDVKDHILLKM